MLGGLILFITLFSWTHRALFFLKPLADMGVAGTQYRLALALREIRHGPPPCWKKPPSRVMPESNTN
jgi:hypothetical protein